MSRSPSVKLSFKCHIATHVSGRVTVTVVDLPELAVHASNVAAAVEELTLALDDRIARAHPRQLFDLCRPSAAEPVLLDVPVLRVRGAVADEAAPLRIYALHAPAHRPFTEVRAPRLDTRLWFDGKDWRPQAEALLHKQLEPLDDAALLDLRPEAPESWIDVVIDATPTLAQLLAARSDAPPQAVRIQVVDDSIVVTEL
jgi:ATP-dependent Clp protease ATP-binding subunit ClpC